MTLSRKNLKVGLVAFVDLLGFSARVAEMETTNDLERLEIDVARVQKWFDHKPTDAIVKETQKIISKTVMAFSDCIVISVPVRSELADQEGDFDILMNELTNFAMAQGQCAVNSVFLRGGADFGLWYRKRDTLISPAMVNAYQLEGRACVPMLAVTDELYDHLARHAHRNYYHASEDPIPKVLRRYDNLPNGQGAWFIDYIPICLNALDGTILGGDIPIYRAADSETKDRMRSAAYLRDCVQWLHWHADAIRAQYSASADDHVRSKYVWLGAYHDEAVRRFFRTPSADLFVGELTGS